MDPDLAESAVEILGTSWLDADNASRTATSRCRPRAKRAYLKTSKAPETIHELQLYQFQCGSRPRRHRTACERPCTLRDSRACHSLTKMPPTSHRGGFE